MLHLDATELYDLSEAGRMLFADPARLRRWARQQRIPLVRRAAGDALPRAWVDAETGRVPSDAEALRRYWLERLQPAAPEAQRATEDRERLPSTRLLDPAAAARCLYADPARLRRLADDGSVPVLHVDGGVAYDAELLDLLAARDRTDEAGTEVDARREAIVGWGRFAYVTGLRAGAEPPPAFAAPAPAEAVAVAPHAWRIPDDVASLEVANPEAATPEALPAPPEETSSEEAPDAASAPPDEPPPPRGRLIEADGFETVDEDP